MGLCFMLRLRGGNEERPCGISNGILLGAHANYQPSTREYGPVSGRGGGGDGAGKSSRRILLKQQRRSLETIGRRRLKKHLKRGRRKASEDAMHKLPALNRVVGEEDKSTGRRGNKKGRKKKNEMAAPKPPRGWSMCHEPSAMCAHACVRERESGLN